MTPQEFDLQMGILAVAWNGGGAADLPAATKREYAVSLQHLDHGRFVTTGVRCRRRLKFFPTISEILDEYNKTGSSTDKARPLQSVGT